MMTANVDPPSHAKFEAPVLCIPSLLHGQQIVSHSNRLASAQTLAWESQTECAGSEDRRKSAAPTSVASLARGHGV